MIEHHYGRLFIKKDKASVSIGTDPRKDIIAVDFTPQDFGGRNGNLLYVEEQKEILTALEDSVKKATHPKVIRILSQAIEKIRNWNNPLEKQYVMLYPCGSFVGVDNDAGYPYKCSTPHIWNDLKEMSRYNEMFTVEEFEGYELAYKLTPLNKF
jgi:hypothetical protein